MARSNVLNTRTINYLELIGNGKHYRVPPYQRDYSWSDSKNIPGMAPEQWTPELLEERQRRLAARAVHLWRVDSG